MIDLDTARELAQSVALLTLASAFLLHIVQGGRR